MGKASLKIEPRQILLRGDVDLLPLRSQEYFRQTPALIILFNFMNKSSTFSILAAFSPVIQASARFQSNTVNSLQRYLDSTKTSSILA